MRLCKSLMVRNFSCAFILFYLLCKHGTTKNTYNGHGLWHGSLLGNGYNRLIWWVVFSGVFSSSEFGSRTEKIFRLKTIVISSSSLIIINQEETLEQDKPKSFSRN